MSIIEIYYLLWLFIIYSVMGWITEVAYSAVKKGKLINRGFLNGAWCPIYGAGAVAVIFFLSPIRDNIILLFILSLLETSFIEFVTGFTLEKIYKCRWWDYSDRRFNLWGYICLRFSLIWGLVGAIFVKVINPIVIVLLSIIPLWLGVPLLWALTAAFIVDTAASVMAARHLVSRIDELDKIAKEIHKISDDLSKIVYKDAMELSKKHEELNLRIVSLKALYQSRLDKKPNMRLIKAFPGLKMRLSSYQEQLNNLKSLHNSKKH